MVAFYNMLGGLMWVTESRAEEYRALGYREYVETPLVPAEEPKAEAEPIEPEKVEKPAKAEKVEKTTKSKTVKKSVTKKK